MDNDTSPEIILRNGKITTMDPQRPEASSVAIAGSTFCAVGDEREVMARATPQTKILDLRGRRLIPGLVDGHIHLIRGGLTYNLELRWDGITSLDEAMRMLKVQVGITPPPQWVRVVGGFSLLQFREKRLPTLEELNRVAPETPVLILHLYDRALLNAAALRALGYDKSTPDPVGARIQRNKQGEPTGLIVSEPVNTILYQTMDRAPKLNHPDQVNSTKHFMRELNRLGVTGIIDAGGGFNPYPDNYKIAGDLVQSGEATLRMSYNLLPQSPRAEMAEFRELIGAVRPRSGSPMFRPNGAGEMLVYSAYDFEDFRFARPELPSNAEEDLEPVVRFLAESRWPFRMHATYDETIQRELAIFERVHRDLPIDGLHWFFDHAETVSERSLDRIARMGGGIAIQHRMAYQDEFFLERYGKQVIENCPPIRTMLEMGLPVGAGTDATRVSSHNPWVCFHWLCAGKGISGRSILSERNRLDRREALYLWTAGNAWFTDEIDVRGRIAAGFYADAALLSEDLFAIPEDRIPSLTSLLTIVNGVVVHGEEDFRQLAPPLPPASPDWSPVNRWPGYPSISVPDNQRTSTSSTYRLVSSGHRHGPGGCMCWAW